MEENKKVLSEEKTKRLVVAGTVGAVMLAVILLFVMIYQLISIAVYNKRIENYNAKIAEYEQLIKDGENSKETFNALWWIEREARELGLVYPDDFDLN